MSLYTLRRRALKAAILAASVAWLAPSAAHAASTNASAVPANAAALAPLSAGSSVVGTAGTSSGDVQEQLTFTPTPGAATAPNGALTGASQSVLGAATPSTTSETPYHVYTASNPGYTWSGAYGTFSGQATMSSGTLAWGWSMSQLLRDTATGPVAEVAACWNVGEDFKINYGDSHPSEPISYFWHSSIPGLGRNVEFELIIGFTWPGTGGVYQLYVEHYFTLQAS